MANAAINSNADAAPPFLRHQSYSLNHRVSSWMASPAHAATTAPVDTYPAISQQDRDAIKDDMAVSEGMEQHAHREAVMADILGAALGIVVVVRLIRFIRR